MPRGRPPRSPRDALEEQELRAVELPLVRPRLLGHELDGEGLARAEVAGDVDPVDVQLVVDVRGDGEPERLTGRDLHAGRRRLDPVARDPDVDDLRAVPALAGPLAGALAGP